MPQGEIPTVPVFSQLPLGNTEKIVDVEVRITASECDASAFIGRNAVPDKALFYELVGVILKRYFGTTYDGRAEELFREAWAYEGTATLRSRGDRRFYDEIKPRKAKHIYPNAIRSRLRKIEEYSKIGPPFPPPLYMQAKIIEGVVGRAMDERDIIMVDGARRIVAGCLCGLREMKVVLITKERLKSFGERSSG